MERDAGAPYDGLDHPNVGSISRPVSPPCPRPVVPLFDSMFGCLSVRQILRMVRVADKILPRFRARCWRRTL